MTLQLSFTEVRAAPLGSGKRKMKPGHSHPETFKRLKHTVVTIKDKDDLCCGRAFVTAKAKVDGHPNWDGFKKGRAMQKSRAIDLYFEAGVQRGPCGYEELTKFSMAHRYTAISFWSLMKPAAIAWIRLDPLKTSSSCCYTISSTMTSSPVSQAILVPAISVDVVWNLMATRGNTAVATTRSLSSLFTKLLLWLSRSQSSAASSLTSMWLV